MSSDIHIFLTEVEKEKSAWCHYKAKALIPNGGKKHITALNFPIHDTKI